MIIHERQTNSSDMGPCLDTHIVGMLVKIRRSDAYDDVIPNSDPVEGVLPVVKRPACNERQIAT